MTTLNTGEQLTTRGIYLHPSDPISRIGLVSSTLDQSGYYGVVVGFRAIFGSDRYQMFYALADNADAQNALSGTGLRRVAAQGDPIASGGPLAVGNFNGSDKLTARYLDQCRTVTEAHLNAVVFMPPHWSKLNASGTSGRFGRGNSEANEVGTSVRTTKGGSVNASLGVGFNASFDFRHGSRLDSGDFHGLNR
ncbi:MAG: hypothetical protein HC828_16220 [Blastochloris sp.]|nr:hypothetical protein [Blastochloris sp.]